MYSCSIKEFQHVRLVHTTCQTIVKPSIGKGLKRAADVTKNRHMVLPRYMGHLKVTCTFLGFPKKGTHKKTIDFPIENYLSRWSGLIPHHPRPARILNFLTMKLGEELSSDHWFMYHLVYWWYLLDNYWILYIQFLIIIGESSLCTIQVGTLPIMKYHSELPRNCNYHPSVVYPI